MTKRKPERATGATVPPVVPPSLEADEYAQAFGLFSELDAAEASLKHARALKPSAIADYPGMPAVLAEIERLDAVVDGIKDALQDLNPKPLDGKSIPSQDRIAGALQYDRTRLADPEQLVSAFGMFSGMKPEWFESLKDKPGLLAARRVVGKGQRGHRSSPLFCPKAVMDWLRGPKLRVKGWKPLTEHAGWKALQKDFPVVYSDYQHLSPLEDD